jgi:hypothetical protein
VYEQLTVELFSIDRQQADMFRVKDYGDSFHENNFKALIMGLARHQLINNLQTYSFQKKTTPTCKNIYLLKQAIQSFHQLRPQLTVV